MANNYFNRYVWLIDTIQKAGHISFEELSNKWQCCNLNIDGAPLPERTFFNHRKEILSMFGLDIRYDKPLGYCIANEGELGDSSLREWMMNSIAVNNAVRESSSIRSRILFENIPSGGKFLNSILDAMKTNNILQVTYKPYDVQETQILDIAPYCVKLFHQRWYVLGKSNQFDQPRLYSLDRIASIINTGKKFRLSKSFDAKEFFEEHFGIVVDEEMPPQTIRLKVWGQQRNYFRSLPLHEPQAESDINQDWSIFTYHMAPTWDLAMELMKYYDKVEVLEPASLRDVIIDYAYCILNMYGEHDESGFAQK